MIHFLLVKRYSIFCKYDMLHEQGTASTEKRAVRGSLSAFHLYVMMIKEEALHIESHEQEVFINGI